MREHQIIVSLKSNQFQEVERLAKASGFKSVGLFARQQLLAGLNSETAPIKTTPQATCHPHWKNVVRELSRLHKELKVFVTESLSSNQYLKDGPLLESSQSSPEGDINDEPSPAKIWHYYELPTGPSIETASLANDEMEELAERIFASSPQLGALAASKEVGSLYDLLDEHFVARDDEIALES